MDSRVGNLKLLFAWKAKRDGRRQTEEIKFYFERYACIETDLGKL